MIPSDTIATGWWKCPGKIEQMPRYAVVGSSHGTGLAITNRLASEGVSVRAISRSPPAASEFVEPFAADVTLPATLTRALDGPFDAIFFTVDATGGMGNHMLFGSREKIRAVTYQGCLNTIAAASQLASPPKFLLLSVIGSDQSSMMWSVLNVVKTGSKKNVRDREAALRASKLPYVILRAPKLNDGAGGLVATAATPPTHKLDTKMNIARVDLAAAMIEAAKHAPERSTWDVFADDKGPIPAWLRAHETV